MTDHQHSGRRWHDMGGTEAAPAALQEHDYALWEKRVDALQVLTSTKGYFTVDGLRRALEDMGPEAFETMNYYERWIAAVTQNLLEKGVFTIEELNARMRDIDARGASYADASLNHEEP